MVETLNELARLRDVGFGRPWPRHGLKLLHWFANQCLSFDTYNNNSMIAECDPQDGEYGFHLYENRYDQDGYQLLPDLRDMSYYVVGNLNSHRAYELPDDVLEDKSSGEDDSNTDRIIVSLDDDCFDSVYVTKHMDTWNYDPDATFKISRGLLMIIRRMSLQHFLEKTGYIHTVPRPQSPVGGRPNFTVICEIESSDSKSSDSKSSDSKSSDSKSSDSTSSDSKSSDSKSSDSKSSDSTSSDSKSSDSKSSDSKSSDSKSSDSKSSDSKSSDSKSSYSKKRELPHVNISMPETSGEEKGFWDTYCTIL